MLVCPAWWISHVEGDWHNQSYRDFFVALGEHYRVVRYDRIGVGLSDRERTEFSLSEEVANLDAVIDAVSRDRERLVLLGISCGGPPATAWAAAHPERVERLIYCGSYLDGPTLASEAVQSAICQLVSAHWGLGARALADLFAPDMTRAEIQKLSRDQQRWATPEAAARLLELTYSMSVREIAATVDVPALIIHRTEDRTVSFDQGRELAMTLPQGCIKPLSGASHLPWDGDSQEVLAAIFEALPSAPPAPAPSERDEPAMRRRGDVWEITFAGTQVHVKALKGIDDLAVLLDNPGQEVRALELMTGFSDTGEAGTGADAVLDEEARWAFRRRIETLDERIAEAERNNDLHRLERCRLEREQLLNELTAVAGFGGRSRRFTAPDERARKAVSARIRATIQRLAEVHPPLGDHLSESVTTGLTCTYHPATSTRWRIQT